MLTPYFRKQLEKRFPGITFTNDNMDKATMRESIHAEIVTPKFTKKLGDGGHMCYLKTYLYISNPMYPHTAKNFVYLTLATNAQHRPYRAKLWRNMEVNKVFFSAKTQKEVIQKLVTCDWKPIEPVGSIKQKA